MPAASLILMALFPLLRAGEPVSLPVTADTSLQAHPSETTHNSGGSSSLRLKGNEHYLLLKFDVRPIAGWRVTRATLHLHSSHPHLLRTVGLSTVAADWQEGSGTGGPATDGCTYTRAAWPDTLWAGPDSRFLDVALTHGNTLVRYSDIRDGPDGWLMVDVDPLLVHALLSGASYGLCLSDEKGQTAANNDVHSREQRASAPYLVVEGGPARDLPALPRLEPVSAEPWPPAATFETGAVRLRLRSPGTFRYELSLREADAAERVLPLYRTPRPLPAGQEQFVAIAGLQPGGAVEARVCALDEFGRRSNVQAVSAQASAAKARPEPLPSATVAPLPGREPSEGNGLRLWACPAECKVNPATGAVLEEQSAGSFRRANPVWDGQQAHLEAARGEVLALQVVVENATPAKARRLSVKVVSEGPNALPPPVGVYRNWYVNDRGWSAEYLAPLSAGSGLALPALDNAVPGQANQALTIVWEIPRDEAPGDHGAAVVITDADGGGESRLPLRAQVHGFELPARTTFEVDLNCYGPVKQAADWQTYLQTERQYFAAAHALRCTINSLGYSQSGRLSRGYAPEIAGEGAGVRATDWAGFDEHFGPYLDGSAFSGVRAGVPITHLYLPLHENWPTPMAGHYSAGNDLRKYPDNVIQHALSAPPVETAFDETFKQAFVAITRQFVEHFRERGWQQTDLQCYLNNKYYFRDERSGFRGTSWWCLDEPCHRDDWLALRFFAQLFRAGVGPADDPVARRFRFRGDISRPHLQRDWLDGLLDIMCVSSALLEYPEDCRRYREQGVVQWHYGEANPIAASNLNAEAWALKAWCAGAEGIVPWNSIGGDEAFGKPTPTALLVPGDRFGLTGPVVSLRVLALCRGQQDVEYLNLLAARRGHDRRQMARLVGEVLHLAGRQQQANADDAGRVLLEGLRPEDFATLRRAVARALQ